MAEAASENTDLRRRFDLLKKLGSKLHRIVTSGDFMRPMVFGRTEVELGSPARVPGCLLTNDQRSAAIGQAAGRGMLNLVITLASWPDCADST